MIFIDIKRYIYLHSVSMAYGYYTPLTHCLILTNIITCLTIRGVMRSPERKTLPSATTSRQTSATRTDTTSRLPISLGSTNKTYEPSTHLRPAAIVRHRTAAAAVGLRRPNLNIQRADYRGANLSVRAWLGGALESDIALILAAMNRDG